MATHRKPLTGGHWITTHTGYHLYIRGKPGEIAHGGAGQAPHGHDAIAAVQNKVAQDAREHHLNLEVAHGPPRGPAERKFADRAHARGRVGVVVEAEPLHRVETQGDATRHYIGGHLAIEVRPTRPTDSEHFLPRSATPAERAAWHPAPHEQWLATHIDRGLRRGEVRSASSHRTRAAAEKEARLDAEAGVREDRSVDRIAIPTGKLESHDYADETNRDPHWKTTFRVLVVTD